MENELLKQLAELNDKYQEVKAENDRLRAEIKQLRDFINNSCTYKPSN